MKMACLCLPTENKFTVPPLCGKCIRKGGFLFSSKYTENFSNTVVLILPTCYNVWQYLPNLVMLQAKLSKFSINKEKGDVTLWGTSNQLGSGCLL
jgi:hypothetical protein